MGGVGDKICGHIWDWEYYVCPCRPLTSIIMLPVCMLMIGNSVTLINLSYQKHTNLSHKCHFYHFYFSFHILLHISHEILHCSQRTDYLMEMLSFGFRCVQNPTNQHSMSVYLVEPRTCQYKLVVSTGYHIRTNYVHTKSL